MKKIEIYRTADGKTPFLDWIDSLSEEIQARIMKTVKRLGEGGSKNIVKALGDGIFELKMHFGPGHRVYFGEEKNVILILLTGGDKGTQKRDIEKAKEYWRNHAKNI